MLIAVEKPVSLSLNFFTSQMIAAEIIFDLSKTCLSSF